MGNKKRKYIYLVGPSRNVTEEQKESMIDYVSSLEADENMVFFPLRDVEQDDPTGVNIVMTELEAMELIDEVHIFWESSSFGSHFDLGMAFMLTRFRPEVKIYLVQAFSKDIPGKSYFKVIEWFVSQQK